MKAAQINDLPRPLQAALDYANQADRNRGRRLILGLIEHSVQLRRRSCRQIGFGALKDGVVIIEQGLGISSKLSDLLPGMAKAWAIVIGAGCHIEASMPAVGDPGLLLSSQARDLAVLRLDGRLAGKHHEPR